MATKLTQIAPCSEGWFVDLTITIRNEKNEIIGYREERRPVAGWALAEYSSDKKVVPLIPRGGELIPTADLKDTTVDIIHEPPDIFEKLTRATGIEAQNG